METATGDQVVTVREIMTRDVVTTFVDQSVDRVARELDKNAISGMPVVNADGALVGMVSEYDIISKRGKTAGDIMSRGVISVDADAEAEQVATIVSMHGIRRVPVVRDGELIGIVSRADLVRLFAIVRWTCTNCGAFERGFTRQETCTECGSAEIRLDREPPIG
jgi:CBS-domain-containing membrane protein